MRTDDPTPDVEGDPRLVVGDWASLAADASRVRQAVFVEEQGIPLELEYDRWDPLSVHCVAYQGDRPIGTGRLLPDAHIGRMAVLPVARGLRIGGRLLERLITAGRERGDQSFELSAQSYVAHFYRRHGFVQIGEAYDEVGIPHVRMRLDTSLARSGGCVMRDWRNMRPDGSALHQREWLPQDSRQVGRLYLLHGLGEHLERYEALARFLCSMGWAVRGHDHRGHGRSVGARGVIPRDDALLIDARALIVEWTAEGEDRPVLFGHSMGGALAAQLACREQSLFRALILSSPALSLGLGPLTRLQARLMRRLAPDLAVPNRLRPELLSHDPQVVQAYQSDPLVHDRISGRLLAWMLAAGAESLQSAQHLVLPVLVLVGGADEIIDPQGARQFVERIGQNQAALRWFDGLRHELFNERAEGRAQAIDALRAWLAALPPIAAPEGSGGV